MNQNASVFSALLTLFGVTKSIRIVTSEDEKIPFAYKIEHGLLLLLLIISCSIIGYGYKKKKNIPDIPNFM